MPAAPPPAQVLVLGRSTDGRPIRAVRVGPADAAVRIVVVGCIHGNETAGIAITRELRELRPPAGSALYLVDTLNPDGVARGTRQDAHGVDLNRNFPGTWRPLGSPGSVHYGGPRAASERETRIAVHLIGRLHPQVTIWYHQAQAVVDRSGGNVALERAYARRVGLPLQTIPPQPGEATRWQNATVPRQHGVRGRAARRGAAGGVGDPARAGGPVARAAGALGACHNRPVIVPSVRRLARGAIAFVREIFDRYGADDVSQHAAAIAFRALFALVPLLTLILAIIDLLLPTRPAARSPTGSSRPSRRRASSSRASTGRSAARTPARSRSSSRPSDSPGPRAG